MTIRTTISLTSVALALLATPAFALSAHTWVSGTGSDTTGNGTRALPYATFEQAYKNTILGGIISVADPGDYGPVTIAKSITIDGGGVRGCITGLNSGNDAIKIEAGSTD